MLCPLGVELDQVPLSREPQYARKHDEVLSMQKTQSSALYKQTGRSAFTVLVCARKLVKCPLGFIGCFCLKGNAIHPYPRS